MLNEDDFNTRLEAAVALRKEREGREARSGADHRKDKSNKTKKSKKQAKKEHKRKPVYAKRDEDPNVAQDKDDKEEKYKEEVDEQMPGEEEQPEIDPCQSLFDNHVSKSPADNLKYMTNKYSFYLPDSEYCTDIEGLLGYCSEKIRIGHICLYCQKMFKSEESVLKHMRDKSHCKILYEAGKDLDEFGVFYDFSEANKEYLGVGEQDAMEEDDEWEDVSGDEDMEDEDMDDDNDDLYAAYEKEITTHGFDITPLGELVFPDGRIVGHRGLARYYKQKFAPDRTERAAVRAAKEAAGDRLYAGRVYNMYQLKNQRELHGNSRADGEASSSTALTAMGRLSGNVPTGRMGQGILVAGGGKGGFTSLSLYHYRAVVKKQRRDDARGQRLQQRSRMNMNKMDKKANNKMTGVSVAHAPR